MTISMADWVIDPAWFGRMNIANFNGRSFTIILINSMKRLINSLGEPLRHQANLLTNANAPVAEFVFGGSHMVRYLREGKFKYNQMIDPPSGPGPAGPILIPSSTPQLVISGPDPSLNWTDTNARAGINEDWIQINYRRFITYANNNPTLFPNNATGNKRLEILVGKTILHEVLHNHGFRHPEHPGISYDPTHVYWRTFPEVAEQAYFKLNRTLFPGLTTILNLTGNTDDIGYCGTNG